MFPLSTAEVNWIVKCSNSPIPHSSSSIFINDAGGTREGTPEFENQDEFFENITKHELSKSEETLSKTMGLEEFLAKMVIRPPAKEKRPSLTKLKEMFHPYK